MNLSRLKKYSVIASKKIINQLRTSFFVRTGLAMPRPMRVYYLMTNKCNYKCLMCPQWECGVKEDQSEYITEAEMKKVIDEIASLGIYEFGISGGEALLYLKKMFNLLSYANQKGLYTHFVTNGRLLSEEIIRRYNDIGGGHISLSIDAASPKHDKLRGVPGAFAAIERVLKIFSENKFPNILLKINTVISGANLDEVLPVVELAIARQSVIFIQPYDVYDYATKLTAEQKSARFPLWVKKEQHAQLRQVLDKLITLKKEHPEIILNDAKHLAAIYDYFVQCRVDQT